MADKMSFEGARNLINTDGNCEGKEMVVDVPPEMQHSARDAILTAAKGAVRISDCLGCPALEVCSLLATMGEENSTVTVTGHPNLNVVERPRSS
jgi:hypothetical protein